MRELVMNNVTLGKLVKQGMFRAVWLGVALVLLSGFVLRANPAEWNRQKEAGRKAFEQGRYSEAEALGREALRLVQLTYPAESPEVAGCLNDLGVADSALGKFNEAEELYRRAVQIWKKNP